MYITDKQNKGLFVFDTVFIGTFIWLILSCSPDNGPDKDSIEYKMSFILYILAELNYGRKPRHVTFEIQVLTCDRNKDVEICDNVLKEATLCMLLFVCVFLSYPRYQ